MTKARFRELMKRFHPDTRQPGESNGPLMAVLRQHERQKRRGVNRCWCGTPTYGKHCQMHAPCRFKRAVMLLPAT